MTPTAAEGVKYCVIDCRVSDPQQLKGGSLDDQEAIGKLVAARLGAEIAGIFKKPHSATTTEREDFQEIIDFIKGRGNSVKYYIVKSLDRLTRGGYTEYLRLKTELEKLGVEIVDAQGVIQAKKNTLEHLGNFHYKWSDYSPSEAGEMLEAYKGKGEVRDILTRLIGAEIRLVLDGYAVRAAPDGLKNKPTLVDGKKKIVREPSDRAHYFQKLFELLADGMDYQEVVDRLNAMGFRTQVCNRWDRSDKEHPRVVGTSGGNPLTVKQLQRYVLQTEYAGVSYEKWNKHQPVKMQQFDGIVSVETFNKANRGKIYIQINTDEGVEIKHNYSPWGRVKRLRDNPKYPWKCIACPLCKSEMLASYSTGKSGAQYEAYHCGGAKNGKRAHKYTRVPQDDFEKGIRTYLDGLKFESGFLAGLELHLISEYRRQEAGILMESSAISRTVSDLKAELAKKSEDFGHAESPTMRRLIEAQAEGLEVQIKQAESERGKIEINERSIRGFRRYAEYVMEHPAEILTNADDLRSRRELMSLFFAEVPTYTEIVSGTPKLQPLFRLSDEFKRDKTLLVSPLSLDWNTAERMILQWEYVFKTIKIPALED